MNELMPISSEYFELTPTSLKISEDITEEAKKKLDDHFQQILFFLGRNNTKEMETRTEMPVKDILKVCRSAIAKKKEPRFKSRKTENKRT